MKEQGLSRGEATSEWEICFWLLVRDPKKASALVHEVWQLQVAIGSYGQLTWNQLTESAL